MRRTKSWKLFLGLAFGLILVFFLTASSMENKKADKEMSQAKENEFLIEDGVLIRYTGTALEVTVPKEVTSIGDYAFEGCSSLKSIELPSGLTSIGNKAFSYCVGLTSIELPSGLTDVGDYAFYDCAGLTNIAVAEGNKTYQSYDGCLYSASGDELICCPVGKKEIRLLESMTRIGDGAFSNCRDLTSIQLPSGLTDIGDWAFELCSGLTSIELPSGLLSIGDYAFESCNRLTSIRLPSSLTSIGYEAFVFSSNLTIYGETGSYGESYAKENQIPFEDIGEFGPS